MRRAKQAKEDAEDAVSDIGEYPVEVEVNAGYGDTLIIIVVNVTPQDSSRHF
jgi:hypothetical protein